MAENTAATASAFFAKKKKGKKNFKAFNANKIDASGVPTPSMEVAPTPTPAPPKVVDDADAAGGTDGEWADVTPLHAKQQVKPQVKAQASELIDMRALEEKRRGQDDVKERLRIEETKSLLQKAKEGMEQQAKKLEEEKAEKERKEAEKATAMSATRGGGLSGLSAGGSAKWVPSVKRNLASSGVGSMSARFGGVSLDGSGRGVSSSAGGFQKKVNTEDEEAFPDLAMADKILEHKEKTENKPKYVLPKKIPSKPVWNKPSSAGDKGDTVPHVPDAVKADVGSAIIEPSITVDSPTSEIKPATVSSTESTVAATPSEPQKIEQPTPDTAIPASDSTTPPVTVPAVESANNPAPSTKRVIKKKKKKDVSTFKVGGD